MAVHMETGHNFEYTAQLIIKFLENNLTEQEELDFQRWRSATPDNELLIESFRETAAVQAEINYLSSVDTAGGYNSFLTKLNKSQRQARPLWRKVLPYASAAVVTLAMGFFYYNAKNNNSQPLAVAASKQADDILPGKKQAILSSASGENLALNAANGTLVYRSKDQDAGYNTLRTPRAGEYKLVLPDGTMVWLNASSSLRFPDSFNNNERRVELSGEAYFEVAHNKAKPFIVSFNNTEVRVLGTHFNINAYNNRTQTTLLEGSVIIKNESREQMLQPGQQAVAEGGDLSVLQANTFKSIAWKEGVFYFNSDKLTDILDQVARWYDVSIVYKGQPNTKKYSGNIRRQATLNQVLEMLDVLTGHQFTLKERTVTVNFIN